MGLLLWAICFAQAYASREQQSDAKTIIDNSEAQDAGDDDLRPWQSGDTIQRLFKTGVDDPGFCVPVYAKSFSAAAVDSCKQKVGSGSIRTSAADCAAMGGRMTKTLSQADVVSCGLDWCMDGMYQGARVGTCEHKVGRGSIRASTKDCIQMGGVGAFGDDAYTWVDCELDWCADGRYRAARMSGCAHKVGFGSVWSYAKSCRAMGGATNGELHDGVWTLCYFDWCDEAAEQKSIDSSPVLSQDVTRTLRDFSGTLEEFKGILKNAAVNGKLVIVSLTAPWCKPCQEMKLVLRKVANEYPEVIFLTLDVDNDDLEDTLEMNAPGGSVPQFNAFLEGQLVGQVRGKQEKKLRDLITKFTRPTPVLPRQKCSDLSDPVACAKVSGSNGHARCSWKTRVKPPPQLPPLPPPLPPPQEPASIRPRRPPLPPLQTPRNERSQSAPPVRAQSSPDLSGGKKSTDRSRWGRIRPRTKPDPVDMEAEPNGISDPPSPEADPVRAETGEMSMVLPSTGGEIDAGTCRQKVKNVIKSFSGSEQEFRGILGASAAKGSLVVVYFKAEWCHNCKQMTPAIQQMVSDHPYVEFLEIDVDSDTHEQLWCWPRALPTVKAFRGSDVVGEVEGVKVKNVEEMIRKFEGAVPEKCSNLRSAAACVGLIKNNIRVCCWDEDGKDCSYQAEVAPVAQDPTRVAPGPATQIQSGPKATPQNSDPATTKTAPELRSKSASQSFLVLIWIPIIIFMR